MPQMAQMPSHPVRGDREGPEEVAEPCTNVRFRWWLLLSIPNKHLLWKGCLGRIQAEQPSTHSTAREARRAFVR